MAPTAQGNESDTDVVMQPAEEDREYSENSDNGEDSDPAERRRVVDERMAALRKEFVSVKDKYYLDKAQKIDSEIAQLQNGDHSELKRRLEGLEKSRSERIRIAELYRKFQMENITNQFASEKKEAETEFTNKKKEAADELLQELIERKRKLEDEKNNVDIAGEIPEGRAAATRAKLRRRQNETEKPAEKRRKPVTISGPHIVYQLTEQEIADDIVAMKKVVTGGASSARESKSTSSNTSRRKEVPPPPVALPPPASIGADETIMYEVNHTDGQIKYDGRTFEKGNLIFFEGKDTPRTSGVITAINSGEVWVRKDDGGKTKLYISQLRLGKYILRHK
eukprot:Opistho-2@4426